MLLVLFPQLKVVDGMPLAASDRAQAAALRGRGEVLLALRMGWVAVSSTPHDSSHFAGNGGDVNEFIAAPCARVPGILLKAFLLELFKRIVNQVK